MPDYDVIVLGGGSAGTAAAAAATGAGARTAMINRGELGGLCILRGCMPTKSLLATAHAVHEANHLAPFGATLEGKIRPDFARIMQRKDQHVARFKKAKIELIERSDYEVIEGTARFAVGGGVDVDGRTLTAGRYVIATGSVPTQLPIPGVERVPVLTSDDVMELKCQPSALLVHGAGPVGLELGQFFARIGTEVLLVNRSPLLSKIDSEAGEELARALRDEPRLQLALPGRIDQLRPDGEGLVARVTTGGGEREFRADALAHGLCANLFQAHDQFQNRYPLLHLTLQFLAGAAAGNERLRALRRGQSPRPMLLIQPLVRCGECPIHFRFEHGLLRGAIAHDPANTAAKNDEYQ